MKTIQLLFFSFVIGTAFADPQSVAENDLTALSLEDLMKIEVTSVSRTPEPVTKAAAAVTVITSQDIIRSGATSIPEALRMAPGVQVASVDAHTWAVSARGFNDIFANKLLVMIDGRSVYTPLFSGVFWDQQDTLMEDIDRIEVIRGPGATLWGANAVNGVINIITKSAKDTQGLLISGGTGTEELGFGGIRYGAKLNDQVSARVYGKYFNRDNFKLANGDDAHDRWDKIQGGFRMDWEPSDANLFTFQGDTYAGTYAQTFAVPTFVPPFAASVKDDIEVHGGNLLGRWSHTFSEDSQMTLQSYFDHTTRNTPIFSEDRDTADVDFQHGFVVGERQRFVWGGGFRRTVDESEGTVSVSLFPANRTSDLYSAFLQDEISLVPDKFTLTAGSKFEHNDFTGFEVQPSTRLLFTPHERHAIWTSVSRAVRTPSRAEDDVTINPTPSTTPFPPGFASAKGSRTFDSEKLIAYELGYRLQPIERWSVDVATFYNDYDDLRSLEPTGVFAQQVVANNLKGESYGVEVASTVQALENWRLSGGYSYLQLQIHRKNGSTDTSNEAFLENASPHHQVFMRSAVDFGRSFDFGHEFEFDSIIRYVDSIAVFGTPIASYWSLDLRLAWRPSAHWEVALIGQNLLDNQHPEFAPTNIATQPSEVERSVYAKLTVRF